MAFAAIPGIKLYICTRYTVQSIPTAAMAIPDTDRILTMGDAAATSAGLVSLSQRPSGGSDSQTDTLFVVAGQVRIELRADCRYT